MGPAFYVMAILGCADTETACQQVRVAQTEYATEEACTYATSNILYENSDIPFPVVMAECRQSNRSMAAREGKPRG